MKKETATYKISPKGKRKLHYPTKSSKSSVKLPLIGKTIFLDVKDPKHLKTLRQDLKKLGATLEDFVSCDINYLITSQPRPRNKGRTLCGEGSPTPSPFNCDPSPSPGNHEEKKVTAVTRGKALAEKARYTRQTNTLLDNAEKWGVKIVCLEGAFKWIDRELKRLPKAVGNLSKKSIKTKCVSSYKIFKSPFVKVEADSYCYRPFHAELEVWPRLNVDTPRGSCPFDGTLIKGGEESREERGDLLAAQVDIPSEDTPKEEKDGSDSTPKPSAEKTGKKSESDIFTGSKVLTAGELKRRKDLKRRQDRKRGYCECCHVKYEDLDKHVMEDQHRLYVKNKSHYQQLDALIMSGPNTEHFLFDYLTKATHIVTMRNFNGNSPKSPMKSVNLQTRRSPRKLAKDQTTMANRSPSKARCPSAQLLRHSPRKAVHDHTAHVLSRSPRINLQKQERYEITPAAEEDKLSPVTRNHKNSENKEKKYETVLIRYAKATITESGTMSRARQTVPQKVKNSKIEPLFQENITKSNEIVVQDVEKIDAVESLQNVVNSPRQVMTNRKHEISSRTLSPRKLNRTVLSEELSTKSPQKQVVNTENVHCSPRKQVSEKLTGTDKIESGEHIDNTNLNKENICLNLNGQDVEEPVTKYNLIEANPKECEDSADNSVEHAGNGKASVGRSRKCKGKSISFGNRTEIPIESSGKLNDSEHIVETNVEHTKDLDSVKADVDNYELTKVGFYELVKCGKERTMVDRSSDDFEVCYARSFVNETLPELKKDVNEDTDNTSGAMMVQCKNNGAINITSDIRCKFGGSDTMNESKGDSSLTKHQKLSESKQHGARSENICTPEAKIDMDKCEKENVVISVNKNKKLGKQSAVNEGVFDIDMQSDIPSDFQCLDSQGTLHTFTKTLAERIKERSMGRRSLVDNHSVNALYRFPSSSHNNSVISDMSDRTANTGQHPKFKSNVQKLEKQKNGSSIIASSKVVNKYRNRRLGLKHVENNQIGYQGDDEHEKTPESLKLPYSQKRKKTYWHYEAVVDICENNKHLQDLPKELRHLKEGNMWFSSDNSDTNSRRYITRVNKTEKQESKRTDRTENGHMECQEVVGNIGTLSTKLNQKEKAKKQRTKHDFVGDVSNKIVQENEKINASEKEPKRSQGSTRKKFCYYVNEYAANEELRHSEHDTNLPRKLSEHKESFTHVTRQDKLQKLGKKKPEVDHSRVVSGKINPGGNCLNIKCITNKNGKKPCSIERTEGELNKEMKVKNISGHENSNLECIKVDKSVVSKQGTSNRYWHFVEEAIPDVKANRKKECVKNLPKELRNLKECWTDVEMLDKCSRRKQRNVSEYAEVTSETESDHVDEDSHENQNATSENRLSIKVRSRKHIAKCDSVHQQEMNVEEDNGNCLRRGRRAASLYSFAGGSVHMVKAGRDMQRRFSRVNYKENDTVELESNEDMYINKPNNIGRKHTSNPDARYGQVSQESEHLNSTSIETESELSSERGERKPANFKGKTIENISINNQSTSMTDNESRKQKDEVDNNVKTQVSSRYWDYMLLPEEDKIEGDSAKYLSKELRLLETSVSYLVTSNNSDADCGRKGRTCRRQSKFMDNNCYTIEIEQASATESTKTKLGDLNSIIAHVRQGEETHFVKPKHTSKKYWDYVVEAVNDAGNSTGNINLPKELRELKEPSFWNTGTKLLNRRSRSKNRRNITENRTGNEKEIEICKDEEAKNVVSIKSSAKGELEDRGRENVKVIVENKEKTNGCPENKKDYIETSESDHSKSRSRKSHVYWDYGVVPVESSSLETDKSLPKDFQVLQSTWNNLPKVENSSRRSHCTDSRSRQEQNVKHSRQDKTGSIKYSNRSVHRRVESVTDIDSENKTSKPEQRIIELSYQDKSCPIKNTDRTVQKNDEYVEGAIKKASVIRTGGGYRSLKSLHSQSDDIDPVSVDTLDENKPYKEQLRKESDQQHPDNVSNQADEDRSVSPVFSIIQNSGHKVVRRCSPVFKRSPRPFKSRTSKEVECINHVSETTKTEVMKSKRHLRIEPSLKLNSPIKCVVSSLHFGKSSAENIKDLDVYCTDSEDEIHRHNSETVVDANISYLDYIVKTPDKSVELTVPGSGYTNTPREARRKRKRQESKEDGALCENKEKKRKKMECVNDAGPSAVVMVTNTIDNRSHRRLLKLNLEESYETGGGDGSRIDLHTSCVSQQITEHEDINEVSADRFSLTWKPVSVNKDENSSEKVKLNKSWTMLSERSVSKLLSSEDGNEHFDGFTGDDKMPSDMSYEEQSEVEIINDSEHEWVVEDKDVSSGDGDHLERLVPVYFPSPNKTSNSSWNDAVEHYIDHSVKQGPESLFRGQDSSNYISVNGSLRKSPVKRFGASPLKITGFQDEAQLQSPVQMNRLRTTPKKKRHKPSQSPEIEKVDAEIEFNFGSPQKNRCDFSPLRTINGVVKHLASPVPFSLTSTPVGTKCRKQKHGKQ